MFQAIFVIFLWKTWHKKINLFSILFPSLLCMRKLSFLKDSSLLCTYSSSCPLPHKNITFCRSKTKKVGPILTKIVQEWDSFKSGSVLRFNFIFLAFFSFKRGKRSSLDLIFGIFRWHSLHPPHVRSHYFHFSPTLIYFLRGKAIS